MTYSILAHDPDTGHVGVAMQTYWFDVASRAMWATAGVGAVATQATGDPSYGQFGLGLMRQGMDPARALERLRSADSGREHRQVAFIDTKGELAAYTGNECIPHAGNAIGEGVIAQGNMMRNPGSFEPMVDAFQSASGDLGQRLLAGLQAGEKAGGELRGMMFAAIRIVRADRPEAVWMGTVMDLRVAHSHEPLAELGRLLAMHRAYEGLEEAYDLMDTGDHAGARPLFEAASAAAPEDMNIAFATAVNRALGADMEGGVALLRQIVERSQGWNVVLAAANPADYGIQEADEQLLERFEQLRRAVIGQPAG